MKYIPVQSSMIDALGYNPDTRELVVQFSAKNEDSEPSYYSYQNVDPHTVTLVLFAESVGKAFIEHVKNKPFSYIRLTSADEAFAKER